MNSDIVITLLAVVLFAAWLQAEFRGSKTTRIVLGCVAIGYIAFLSHVISLIVPRYEIKFVSSSIKQAETLMNEGKIDQVKSALQAYNATKDSRSTYAAAMEMWYVVNHGPRDKKNNAN